MLYLKCEGQTMRIDVDDRIADKYINANTVHFEFCERWNDMVITAQFTQKQKNPDTGEVKCCTYNAVVDDVTHTVTMPNEITAGEVEISAFGEHPQTGVRITSIPVKKRVDKSGFVGNGETPIPPTPDLYTQLLKKISETEVAVDDTLSKAGVAADAQATGDAINSLNEEIGVSRLAAPRAQVRQLGFFGADGKRIYFIDMYVPANWAYSDYVGQYSDDTVFGLEMYKTTSTAQRVFKSVDGGKTWVEYASLPMDAPNGVWYTDFVVDPVANVIYLVKNTDGAANKNNVVCSFYKYNDAWTKRPAEISLGVKQWLSNNSVEICVNPDKTARVVIFGEYGTTTDGTTYSIWRTANNGAAWEKVLEIVGDDNTSGTMIRGDIRHWHTVKADPYTKHLWAAAGDVDSQCKIYRSVDGGITWELMFSGSQRERTCGFVFEADCIYYGMDAKSGFDPNFTKIVKIDRSKLDSDRDNAREDVAIVDSCRSVYGLTRTFYPDGFIVWTQQEPDSAFKNDRYVLQFYDYGTKKLYPIARFDISGINASKYIGFYAGSKCQLLTSGVIFAKPTNSMHQERYGFSFVSKYIKINLTM